jgi:predicted glycoside hydrolase/deacetylase ChbG (UPF0249 family)
MPAPVTSNSRPAIVINADDLGISPAVNQAIVACLEHGLTTSATIMANMPGFADACAAIHDHGLADRIGIHLNLTEGPPLTDPIRSCPRLCRPSGELSIANPPLWRLGHEEATAIETELAAQIDVVLEFGITPSHFDSHHHVHTQWPISTIVMRLARRYGVTAIRLTRNCGPIPRLPARIYKTAFNWRLARASLAPSRHFGSAADAATLVRFDGPVEVMVHPSLDVDGRVVDITPGARPLEEVAAHWRSIGTLTSYRDLGRSTT